LLPGTSEVSSDWIDNGHVFSSEAAILEGRRLGLVVLDIEAGDLIYFPSAWYHEVHNLSPGSVAITNAVPWPEKKKPKKKDPKNMLGKRTLGENLAAFQLISTRADKKQRDLTKAFSKALLVAANFPRS
jgi:oxalate decarboxylase/phosphoglucose isomerase-like protein (cupin superfamily)